jgi:tRNA threonylcarbamoyladenosine biosynthesis protein TsaB
MTYRVLYRAEQLLASSACAGPVLGIDTATPVASLALIAEGRVLAEISEPVTAHGAALPSAVESLFYGTGFGLRDLAAVAVGIGPGSFTGLRVSLSYAKGLAMATGCAIMGVPSLDSFALCALEEGAARPGDSICAVLDARKGEVYAALYRVGPDALEKITGDLIVTLEYFAPCVTGDVVFLGDARAEDAGSLASVHGRRVTVLRSGGLRTHGRIVAAMGARGLVRNEVDAAATLEPLYVRSAEATFSPAAATPGVGAYGASRRRDHPAARLA